MAGVTQPLRPADAKKLLRAIVAGGEVGFTSHALDEMEHDGITQAEAIGVLRSGVVEPAEFERGGWRYRVRARRTIAAIIVTAWRVVR
jgi:hypothetical protein